MPKNFPCALGADKEAKVIALYEEFPEIATNYVLGIKAGISASSVGRIMNKHFPQEQEVEKEIKEVKSCEWLKLHTCWSIDTLKYLTNEGYLYIKILLEEYSRVTMEWLASMSNTADRAVRLVTEVADTLGTKPLVLKFDRGSEFKNNKFMTLLADENITGLVSPGHYPGFNGKTERNNCFVEKFLTKKKMSISETYERLQRAMYCLNHEKPRMIFNGKTGAQVYAQGKMYKESERPLLKQLVFEHHREIEKQKNTGCDKLDIERKSVVKSLVEMGLCALHSGSKNANQLAEVCA